MGILDISGFGTGSPDYFRLREGQRPAIDGSFAVKRVETEKRAPYAYLADENGFITYKGVTFYCDNEKQTLNLGDVSDEKNVLRIPLEEGGSLLVNRANLGDLSRAISMFSAEDVRRILGAIRQDAQCAGKIHEIDELESSAPEAGGEEDAEQEA